MIDLREQVCGDCKHFRPFADDPSGICGGVLPEGHVWGVRKLDDGSTEPQLLTIRPEVHKDSPSCFKWEPWGVEPPPAPQAVPQRTPYCKIKGCGCLRDGDSDFCADHEPDEPTTLASEAQCMFDVCPNLKDCAPKGGCQHPVVPMKAQLDL